ncbi:DUF4244 domain-containing protein [Austwickia chelonae]|uniref:DUF4244 domain-containing protein n=1 Tax=Austwickia chelonae TaxID=100225 RepID=UPI000E285F04|nr:DUF4244 domain-containing protein [Austwickia chelonae]
MTRRLLRRHHLPSLVTGRPGRRAREAGMTTAEYAIGTVAACTFAALLIAVVRSPEIKAALLGIITRALGLGQ